MLSLKCKRQFHCFLHHIFVKRDTRPAQTGCLSLHCSLFSFPYPSLVMMNIGFISKLSYFGRKRSVL
jgi:hypothetical protein